MGNMLEMMGFMPDLSAPCMNPAGGMSMMGDMGNMTGTMPMMGDMGNMTDTMPIMGAMGDMTGTMPMMGGVSNGAMLRMMGRMMQTMGDMQAMMDAGMMGDMSMMEGMDHMDMMTGTMTGTMPMMGDTDAMMAHVQNMMNHMHAAMAPCLGQRHDGHNAYDQQHE